MNTSDGQKIDPAMSAKLNLILTEDEKAMLKKFMAEGQRGGEFFTPTSLVKLIVEESHTCYLGERGRRFEWGHGCGECPACSLRAISTMGFSPMPNTTRSALQSSRMERLTVSDQ